MRIAALAFGVLAGLVASFILALGGLDAAELRYLDGRQMQLVTFGLFVIANLGVLGAGLVLAVPLAGAVLFVVGAIGWLVAALAMHHGPDYVMLTPPGILILAAALSIAAFIRRRRSADEAEDFGRLQSAAAQRAAIRDAGEDEEDDDEADTSGVAVGASFFGDAGTATPMRGAMPPAADPRRDSWEPVRRRVEPPRQKPMFRSVEDEYDDEDESGVSRVARGISSVLSFGLYGTLAAAAVLIFWNLRSGDMRNTATKIEASASIPHTSAPVLTPPSSSRAPTVVAEAPAAPTLSPTPTASASPELTAPTPPQPSGTARPAVAATGAASSTLAAAPTPSPTPVRPAPSQPAPAAVAVADASPPAAGPAVAPPEASTAPASQEPQPGDDLAGSGVTGPLMPYPMPSEIAAGRPTAKSRPAAPPAPRADTGL